MTSGDQPKLTRSLFVIIILFTSLAQVTADLYTPSMPYIAKNLSSSHAAIQLSMAVYMFGFSASHLFYGPLSDRVGRRSPILAGVVLSVLGSILCAIAPTTLFLLLGRLLQGIGLGACSSVGRPILRDLLSGGQLAKLGSNLGMINVFVVAAAPILGGYIQHFFDWRTNFYFLTAYSASTWLLLYYFLPETNLHLDPNATKWRTMIRNYKTVICNRIFSCYTISAACAYGGLIAYMTIAPFLYQTLIGLNAVQFGWLSICTASSFFISTFLNGRLVFTYGIYNMVSTGNYFMLISAIAMLTGAMTGLINVYIIILPMTLYAMGAGFTFANAFAGAFNPFPRLSGSAGALYGFIQIMAAALGSMLISLLPEHNQTPISLLLLTLSLASFFALRMIANVVRTD